MEMMGGKAWGRGGKRSREMKQRRREDEKQKEISSTQVDLSPGGTAEISRLRADANTNVETQLSPQRGQM